MSNSYHLGTAFGIPVRAHWSVVALLLVLGVVRGPAFALGLALVWFIVLLHEFGHSLVAQRYGIRVAAITLWPLGGMAHMSVIPEDPKIELRVALAGPLTNFAFALPTLALVLATGGEGEGFGWAFAWWWTAVHLVLGGFNLLPAFPMDGGRVLRALLVRSMGYLRATETAVRVGRWLAFGMVLVWLTAPLERIGFLLIAGFVWLMGGRELLMVRLRHGFFGPLQESPFGRVFQFGGPFDPQGGRGAGRGPFGPQGDPFGPTTPPAGPGSDGPAGPEILGPAPGSSAEGFSEEEIERLERWRGRLPKK